MAWLNSPSDNEVESRLGYVIGSWEPLPMEEVTPIALLPPVSVNRFPSFLVGLIPFILGGTVAVAAGLKTGSPRVGALTALVILGVVCFAFVKLGSRSHKLTRLGVFASGIRYGRSLVRFDELQLVTFALPKSETFSEKHLPTLRMAKRAMEKRVVREAREIRERSEELALTLWLHDGAKVVWLSFSAMYSKETQAAFFALLEKHAPEQFQGLTLSVHELRDLVET